DFGAGTGLWLQVAAALGCRTSAAEIGAGAAASLAQAGHQVFNPAALPSNQFDLINTEQVFEHLVDPRGLAIELARALRPGGILRISVPNGSDVRALLAAPNWTARKGSEGSLNAVAPLEHLNCFDHRSLLRLGSEAGLQRFR